MVEYACALVRETRRSTWLNLLCRSTANQPGSPASLAILAAIRRASSRVSSLARQLRMDAFPPDSRYHWGCRTAGRVAVAAKGARL
jgi:hypothetical protein